MKLCNLTATNSTTGTWSPSLSCIPSGIHSVIHPVTTIRTLFNWRRIGDCSMDDF